MKIHTIGGRMDIDSTVELHTGHEMPVLGLGTWKLTDNTAETIAKALSLGYKMIDTSGDYGTQPGVGEGLQMSGVPREDIFIVTKVEETGDAYEAARKNLWELQVDYVNLMLLHRPPQTGVGEHLWLGLIQARDEGLIKDIGVSNYSFHQIDELTEISGEMPVVNQIEWSPFGYDLGMYEYCQDNNIIIQAYSPLTRDKRLGSEQLAQIAERYHKTPAQILIRWNLQLGTVPLPKANSENHLRENIDVFDFSLSNDDMDALSEFNQHYSALSSTLQYF